jgi:hypothetical protein
MDWATNVQLAADPEDYAASLEASGANIHFHVWDYDAMREFFHGALSLPEVGLAVEYSRSNRGEAIWILRKPNVART